MFFLVEGIESQNAARTNDPLVREGDESTGAFDEKNIPAGSFFSFLFFPFFLFFFFRRDMSSMTRTEAAAQKTSLRLRARAGSRCYLLDTGERARAVAIPLTNYSTDPRLSGYVKRCR